MTVEEIEEFRLLVKRSADKRWTNNGGSVIRSRSVAQARLASYQERYGADGFQFKVQGRKVKIESTQWKDVR